MMERTCSNCAYQQTRKHRVPAMFSGDLLLFLRAVRASFQNGGPPRLKRLAAWLLLELSGIVFAQVGSKRNGGVLFC